MKTALAVLFVSVLLHAEETAPVPAPGLDQTPHAEAAEVVSHAEAAESESHAESAEPAALRTAEPQAPNPACSGGRGAPRPPLHAEVSLIDGSLLKGTLRQRFIPARSPNLGRIRIDLHAVESIHFEGTAGFGSRDSGFAAEFGFRETRAAPDAASETRRETRLPKPETRTVASRRGPATPRAPVPSRVLFKNGDRLTAAVPANRAFVTMDTLVGRVRIPFDKVASLAIEPAGNYALRIEHSALLYHCTFDSPESISRPAAGPAGKFLGGEFVPGKVGNALRTFADELAAQVDFEPGSLGTRGTIEFWAKMEEATPETVFGDGGNPRFFCLWLAQDMDRPGRNPRSSYLQWSGNDGCGRSGLCAMIQGTTATSEDGWGMRKYPDFLGDPAAWHHYAVVWDENGVAGSSAVLAVFVDGKRIPSGGRDELFRGRNFRRFLESAVLLGFPQRKDDKEPAARHVPFLIDEFKIWSAPKTDF